MSAKRLSLVAIAILLMHVQLVAKQTESGALIRAGQSSSAQERQGLAVANGDTKTAQNLAVVVDLSGIESSAKTSTDLEKPVERFGLVDSDESDFGLGPPANDPLNSPIEDASPAPANWISGAGIERWTRHPVAAAAISFGLVLLGYGLLRKMGGRSSTRRPGRLPRQVIELVGFVPLSPRQQLQLVRLGSKLVLVAVSANGAEPLAEVTDPVEVDQILAACNSGQSALASAIGRWSGRQTPREYSSAGDRRGARALFEA